MTVPWNIGDRVIRVGQPNVYIIESFRKVEFETYAKVRVQHTDERREIRIDVATPVLYRKIG